MTWADDARAAIAAGEMEALKLQGQIADLTKQLDDCKAELPKPPDPTPTPGKSVFGFAGPDPTGKAKVLRVYLNPGDPFPQPKAGVLHFVTYKIRAQKGGTSHPEDHHARALQARAYDGNILLGFHHEPEGPGGADYTAAEYKGHWAKLSQELKSVGATKVRTVWVMMGSSFPGHEDYYPGDSLIDVCGADGYDWCGCKTNQGMANPSAGHRTFNQIFGGLLNFAKAHDKDVAVGEVGSPQRKDGQEADRVKWVEDMIASVQANKRIVAVCYFQHGQPAFACDWELKGASLQAYEKAL